MTSTLIRRAGVFALIAATTTTLTGCGGVIGAKMTYNDVEKAKITDIVLTGGMGDVAIATGPVTETSITRVIRRSSNPGESYRLDGTVLTIDTSCGLDSCSVSYLIKAPAGVKVRGVQHSGDVKLDGVADADIEVASGDLTVTGATGPVQIRSRSGDIRVLDAKKSVKVQGTSGDIQILDAAGPVDAKLTSGDLTVQLSAPGSVTASATSGDLRVLVPAGQYKVNAAAASGDARVVGLTSDPAAKNVIDARVMSGDVTVASGS